MFEHKKIDSKNRRTYETKKLIKIIYKDYYKTIKKFLYREYRYSILELGSGGGNIKEIIKKCITSDQFKKKRIDRIENIYKINFQKNSLSNVILIDVFHHLKFPALALEQIHRVLIKKGRIIMIEPAMGLIPRIIYKLFHYEPNGFEINIDWQKKPLLTPNAKSYFAAQSLPWRAFVLKELNLNNKFSVKIIKPFSDFSFLLSGGYTFRSFYPKVIYPIIKYIDKILTKVSILLFSARMLIILEKK
jgi:SAM-dependent methyltransferase